ncbi:hypothetical protein KCU99_g4129, partial [Aureobasidium melanogenum]
MPVSHVGLTVSHVPSACSFFLSALQPLGYRYVGNQGDSVGFGTDDADFFLSPETPGIARSNAHVAFSATSRSAVRDFYAAALTAGGQPNGAPACRGCNDYIFNAAVLDLDGNSIEVIYHQVDDDNRYTTVSGGSRVLTWRRGIVNVLGDEDRTTFVSARRNQSDVESISPSSVVETTPRSNAPSVTKSPSMPAVSTSGSEPGFQITGKAIIGTILGAAAGAAVAYAMVKSEQDSAQQEADFAEAMSRKSASSRAPSKAPSKMVPSEAQTNKAKTVLSSATTSKTAKASRVPEKNAETAAPRPRTRVHRNYSTTDSVVASRVMEQFSDVESEVPLRSHKTRSVRAIEAAPEPQPIDSKSYHSPTYVSLAPTSRASKKPEQSEAVYLPASRAVVQNPQPGQPSVAPIERQIEYVPASGIALPESRAGSVIGSILGRQAPVYEGISAAGVPLPESRKTSIVGSPLNNDPIPRIDDLETVAPDDSISCVASRHSRHKRDESRHRERSHDRGSRKSSSSKKHRSRSLHGEGSRRSGRYSEADSDATVKPSRSSKYSAASLPVHARSRTGIEKDEKRGQRSFVSVAFGGR